MRGMETLEEMLLKPVPPKSDETSKIEETVKTEEPPKTEDVGKAEEPIGEKPKRSRKPKIPNGEVIPRKKRGAKEEELKIPEAQPAEFFAQQLFGIHQIAALMTGLPVTITEDDAKKLGDAVHGVVKQYDLTWITKFTPILNLMLVVAVVEAPVVIRGQAAMSEKRAAMKPKPFKAVVASVENGLPIKDSSSAVPENTTATGVFANLSSDMKGVELKRG